MLNPFLHKSKVSMGKFHSMIIALFTFILKQSFISPSNCIRCSWILSERISPSEILCQNSIPILTLLLLLSLSVSHSLLHRSTSIPSTAPPKTRKEPFHTWLSKYTPHHRYILQTCSSNWEKLSK